MNALKTIAQQVEQFGIFIKEDTVNGVAVDVYRMDTVTHAHIERDKNRNPKSITFLYGMN